MAEDADAEWRRTVAWWAARQGLSASSPGWDSCAAILAATGWARTVGGAGPYLGLLARGGRQVAQVDSELEVGQICELPSARGCTYLLPAADFALGLAASEEFAGKEMRTATVHLGYTEQQAEATDQAVLDALAAGPLDPAGLRASIGDTLVSFGEPGRKRGVTTNLPISLGRLQTRGAIRRIPADGRLDGQRYAYELWPADAPLPAAPGDWETALVGRYLEWCGSADTQQVAWFTGWGKRRVTKVLAAAGAVECLGGVWFPPGAAAEAAAFVVPDAPHVVALSPLDGLFLLRRNARDFIAPVDRDTPLGRFALAGRQGLSDLPANALVDRGRVIGLWEYSPEDGIVSALFPSVAADTEVGGAVGAALSAVEAEICSPLRDLRQMSLDSPRAREPRLKALRGFA